MSERLPQSERPLGQDLFYHEVRSKIYGKFFCNSRSARFCAKNILCNKNLP
jgi:hypothetical protein